MVNNAGIVNAGNAENKNTEEYRLTMGVHADGGVIPQSRESYVVACCWPLHRFCEATFLQSHTVVSLDCHRLVFYSIVLFSMSVPENRSR